MLLRYKKSGEKIAMGLLSFMPEEKEFKKLQDTIHTYETDPNWHLFLWKKEEDFVGLIGVESVDGICTIHHITVNPSHRGEGIGKTMVDKVKTILSCESFTASAQTKSFFEKCTEA
ncbi:GNAT family N-acetyltransferase [Paenisporosarcina cavernae]|uniref:GNAT family N-acetyltransferase n=1 Tax=Paenisporosarcina cavernae TaxID=2320858 RepID=A0A385YSS0_9BACL|nr:GNAT family N-acetyltransferase [Paenisporosarcina cavernae]AYC29350.1 GNAT family N-acetyltransferase [Paenisporosarcina cavernae]